MQQTTKKGKIQGKKKKKLRIAERERANRSLLMLLEELIFYVSGI
jgi:hypothetical protein